MKFEDKIKILVIFDEEVGIGVERWDEFRLVNDIAFPLAKLFQIGAVEKLSTKGIEAINQTFEDLMKKTNIDYSNKDSEFVIEWLKENN